MIEKTYILITPTRNEEAYIEKTIKAVVSQTLLPKKWVIVNDSSTDNTEKIIQNYLKKHDFIQIVSIHNSGKRNFNSKVEAFNAGFEQIKNISYDFIGNLDADISLNPDYFECILNKFERKPKMGLAGGIILELQGLQFRRLNYYLGSVSGAVQLFRRRCFEEIGGYLPLKYGGIDTVAEVMARMKGWEVKTFPELEVLHHRRIGYSGANNILGIYFHWGVRNYSIGYHPIFFVMKCLFNMVRNKPYILSGISMALGFFWFSIRKVNKTVPDEFVKYFQYEQIQRLRLLFNCKSGGIPYNLLRR